jgi:ADP-dependent NAD(P)H-hydrate dehydratase / NAD(P)H-hydrate epimerase
MKANRLEQIQQMAVTAEQMSAIESRVFAAGMPVAALMEKAGLRLTQRIQQLYPCSSFPRVGVLAGPGHNGGDALVIARELHFNGYEVLLYQPFEHLKELTMTHARYAVSLGIPFVESVEPLAGCDFLVDGWFGFGLTKPLQGAIAAAVDQLNQGAQPILSIDLPSGLHTDTGAVLGTAFCATHTCCLGLWKLAFLQDQALAYMGLAELIDLGLPLADMQAVLGQSPDLQRMTQVRAIAPLSAARPLTTHKYKQGHLLLVCGSRQYTGAAILAGLAARASGVGMLSIAVPESVKPLLSAQLPEALIVGCPEDATGAIASFPEGFDLSKYDAIACGCGLTPRAEAVVKQVLTVNCPIVLDADGLNILAQQGTILTLAKRQAPTLLTPHMGEFKRLFPDLAGQMADRITAVRSAAYQSGAVVLLKGARTAIADPSGQVWVNPESTAALARGGSGDVLTGLSGGLLAQAVAAQDPNPMTTMIPSAVWWHAQAGIAAKEVRTELGVDALTLTQFLVPTLHAQITGVSVQAF